MIYHNTKVPSASQEGSGNSFGGCPVVGGSNHMGLLRFPAGHRREQPLSEGEFPVVLSVRPEHHPRGKGSGRCLSHIQIQLVAVEICNFLLDTGGKLRYPISILPRKRSYVRPRPALRPQYTEEPFLTSGGGLRRKPAAPGPSGARDQTAGAGL